MFNDRSNTLSLLHTRRSGKPLAMVEPGPDEGQMTEILAAATRVPDHGKLAPWRFVIVESDQRDALSSLFKRAAEAEKSDAGEVNFAKLEAMARQGPALVVVLYSPKESPKVPEWEQELSVGAACMQLLNAAHALGFVGSWLTGWPSYSDTVRNAFGSAHERIAGFIYLGSVANPLEERPRPDPDSVISVWGA